VKVRKVRSRSISKLQLPHAVYAVAVTKQNQFKANTALFALNYCFMRRGLNQVPAQLRRYCRHMLLTPGGSNADKFGHIRH